MIEKILFSKVAYAFNKAHQLPKINHITLQIKDTNPPRNVIIKK